MTPLVEKYKPTTVDGFIGVSKPRAVLAAFAAKPYAPAAFLLIGPSGLGKTTMALAMFQAINAEVHKVPGPECDGERIEQIVRTCWYVPMLGHRWHGVLIDEADQITTKAQLQLLSRLDTTAFPPDTIFVLTTNEISKLQERLLSRCRRLDFTSHGLLEPMTEHFRRIWMAEIPKSKRGKPPDFRAMIQAAHYNVREALMTLETEILSPGSFEPPAPDELTTVESANSPNVVTGGAIYTIGYSGLSIPAMREILDVLCIQLLLDCRSSPNSNQGFSRTDLAAAFGSRYEWAGDRLSKSTVNDDGLRWLASQVDSGKILMLLASREAPGDCHRHHRIAVPLIRRGIDVRHIYNDELILASELHTAIRQNRDYAFTRWRVPRAVAK